MRSEFPALPAAGQFLDWGIELIHRAFREGRQRLALAFDRVKWSRLADFLLETAGQSLGDEVFSVGFAMAAIDHKIARAVVHFMGKQGSHIRTAMRDEVWVIHVNIKRYVVATVREAV